LIYDAFVRLAISNKTGHLKASVLGHEVRMLDALVIAGTPAPDAAEVARSLGSLVEGIVPGMLARVCVMASTETPAIAKLCDQSGAEMVTTTTNRAAFDRLSASHLLVLPQGLMMPAGWARLLEAEFAANGVLKPTESMMFMNPWARIRSRLSTGLRRPNPFDAGGIVPLALARTCDFGSVKPAGPMPTRTSKLVRLQRV
jgi:hypothetical protein